MPESLPSSGSPSSLVRSRRRAFRPSERLQRHRERQIQSMLDDHTDVMVNPRRVTPPAGLSDNLADDYGTESNVIREQRFRAKRRKLDDGTFDDETRVISYGDEGRVTPGPLKMEIIRCDGGDYFESTAGSAQLVLQDDKNVYSTKENKCNMLLKHIGGMPFSLTKVVIRAPSDGFDSPIQEGMIFVAMDDDQLLEKTAQYERYSPRSYRFHHLYRRPDSFRPSQEYFNSSRSPLRSIDRSRYLRDPQLPWSRFPENDPELETSLVPGFDVSTFDPSEPEESPSYTPRSPASWRDLDAEYSMRSYTDRHQPNVGGNDTRGAETDTSSESENEYSPPYRGRVNDYYELDNEFVQQRRYLNQMRMAHERGDRDFYIMHPSRRAQSDWLTMESSARRSAPTRTEARSNNNHPHSTAPGNGTSSKAPIDPSTHSPLVASELLAPHARFSMAEAQTSIAINFDPPVAGRYILIKLWASCPGSNIDIQSIIPYGYGGPRFFPSIEIR